MSQTLAQIATNIRNLLRGGRSSNDDLLSLEQIKFQIKYYRSLLIRRDQDRNLNRSAMFEQDLGHVNLIADGDDLRTESKIPAPIRLKNKEALTYIVSGGERDQPIPLIDSMRSPWQQYSKYTPTDSYAIYRGGYVYIMNADVDDVYIRGIFEDPEEVHNFTRENGLDLYDDNSPYPISNDMLQQITQSIVATEGSIVLETPNDKEIRK